MELLAPADRLQLCVQLWKTVQMQYIWAARCTVPGLLRPTSVQEELQAALDYCHIRGVKVYVSVNTLLRDDELDGALMYLADLYRWGADAVIVQDLGLIKRARQELPELELHGSTQMTLHSTGDVQAAEDLGLKRVVLARELGLAAIGGNQSTHRPGVGGLRPRRPLHLLFGTVFDEQPDRWTQRQPRPLRSAPLPPALPDAGAGCAWTVCALTAGSLPHPTPGWAASGRCRFPENRGASEKSGLCGGCGAHISGSFGWPAL